MIKKIKELEEIEIELGMLRIKLKEKIKEEFGEFEIKILEIDSQNKIDMLRKTEK